MKEITFKSNGQIVVNIKAECDWKAFVENGFNEMIVEENGKEVSREGPIDDDNFFSEIEHRLMDLDIATPRQEKLAVVIDQTMKELGVDGITEDVIDKICRRGKFAPTE